MKLTTPQILMLNHASWVRQKRLDARTEERRANGSMTLEDSVNDGASVFNGKRLDELTTEEYTAYLGDAFGA